MEQLRTAIGSWNVTTRFLNADGSVSRSAADTYEFYWIVTDRVAAGRSAIPELNQASAIMFYINESKRQIEMASVGSDGNLWTMTGPLGGEVRMTQEFKTATGGVGRLRFTRFNVAADAFESRMEYTEDGGKTWLPGNHQIFTRTSGGRPGERSQQCSSLGWWHSPFLLYWRAALSGWRAHVILGGT